MGNVWKVDEPTAESMSERGPRFGVKGEHGVAGCIRGNDRLGVNARRHAAARTDRPID